MGDDGKGEEGEHDVAFRSGPQVCAQFMSRHDCRRYSHVRPLSTTDVRNYARSLVAALWCGDCDGRRFFRTNRSLDGHLVHDARNDRVVEPGTMGQLVHGRWFWSVAHHFRNCDRKEVRWLGTIKRKLTPGHRLHVRGPYKAGRRVWIGSFTN